MALAVGTSKKVKRSGEMPRLSLYALDQKVAAPLISRKTQRPKRKAKTPATPTPTNAIQKVRVAIPSARQARSETHNSRS